MIEPEIMRAAKAAYDAERAELKIEAPSYWVPSWSYAQSWQRRPYILKAREAAANGR